MNSIRTITDNLRAKRLSRNYTQEYMADRLGISQKGYSKLENHETRITVDILQRIAEILDYPVHAFFEEKGENARISGYQLVNNSALEKLEDLYKNLLETKESMLRAREAEIEWLHKLLLTSTNLQASNHRPLHSKAEG